AAFKTPSPPQWVADLPYIGTRVVELWEVVLAAGIQEATVRAAPYAGIFIKWFVAQLGNIGVLLIEFLLTVILAGAMYANGELATQRLIRFGRRLAGSGGGKAVFLPRPTLPGGTLWIVVSALAQSLFGGLGLLIAGVPFTSVLTAAMLLLAIAQIGVIPVLGAAGARC